MVHADEDDLGKGDNSKAGEPGPPQNGCVSKVTGNAGARIACGKILKFPLKAICIVGPNGKPCSGGSDAGNQCTGTVMFEQIDPENCRISWDLTGCGKPGEHGFHIHIIHEKADFSNGCISAGPHFNPKSILIGLSY